jgi:hypothetical protein
VRWVVLATAPDQVTAELWIAILREEGVTAVIRSSDAISYLGVSGFGCRVLVAEDDFERARDILGEEVT